MDRAFILAEIRRTAKANGGRALGRGRFAAETGIREAHWSGKLWARWGDAVKEAGLEPNQLQSAYELAELYEHYVTVVRQLGRLPTHPELEMQRRRDPAFPSANTFERLGSKAELVAALAAYCASKPEHHDVLELCRNYAQPRKHPLKVEPVDAETLGSVYLVKSGRHYKIGRSNSAGRRKYEIKLHLPERADMIHTITTDDPSGIEAYWHKRFEAKRQNGEWFTLDAADIAAFRRRKFM